MIGICFETRRLTGAEDLSVQSNEPDTLFKIQTPYFLYSADLLPCGSGDL